MGVGGHDLNAADREALAAQGVEVVTEPYLHVTPVPDPDPARRLVARLAEADWLVLTSARTLPAWRSLAASVDLDATLVRAAHGRLRVAAVGAATAATLPPGSAATLVAHRPDASALLAGLLASRQPPALALLPGSSIARPDLADGLRAAGWQVEVAAVYDTRPVPTRPASAPALAAGDIDAVLLRSPSAVAAVALYAGRPGCAVVATVGPATTAAARALGWEPVELTHLDPAAVAAALAARLAAAPDAAAARHTGDPNSTTPQGLS